MGNHIQEGIVDRRQRMIHIPRLAVKSRTLRNNHKNYFRDVERIGSSRKILRTVRRSYRALHRDMLRNSENTLIDQTILALLSSTSCRMILNIRYTYFPNIVIFQNRKTILHLNEIKNFEKCAFGSSDLINPFEIKISNILLKKSKPRFFKVAKSRWND